MITGSYPHGFSDRSEEFRGVEQLKMLGVDERVGMHREREWTLDGDGGRFS